MWGTHAVLMLLEWDGGVAMAGPLFPRSLGKNVFDGCVVGNEECG
jgi:hypothetical protein